MTKVFSSTIESYI